MLKKLGKVAKIKKQEGVRRTPPGQYVTEKFPVLSFGAAPKIEAEAWEFRIFGLVQEEVAFTWEQLLALGNVTVDAEFHCVTQWSRLDNTWEGVPFKSVLKAARPEPEARFVMAHCYGGYTTNIGLDVLVDDDVLFAVQARRGPA